MFLTLLSLAIAYKRGLCGLWRHYRRITDALQSCMRVGNGLGDVMWPSLIYICTLVLLWIDIDALSINQKSIIQYKTYHPSLSLFASPCSTLPLPSNQRHLQPKIYPTKDPLTKDTSNQREEGWKSLAQWRPSLTVLVPSLPLLAALCPHL